MPSFQQLRFMTPVEYCDDPIYGEIKQKGKKSKGKHPLFEDLKARHSRERVEMMKAREMAKGNLCSQKFDSLKLLGSCNDLTYLDSFMSVPRQRHPSASDESAAGGRLRKSCSPLFGKGNQNSANITESPAVTVAMLASLKSAASDDHLYESMEMIHYKKTLQNLHRIKKTKSLQKTGHSLFDALREEQALKQPLVKKSNSRRDDLSSYRSQEYLTSDGNSPSNSSSASSSDEYDIYPKLVVKQSTKNPRHKHNSQHVSKNGGAFLAPNQGGDNNRTSNIHSKKSRSEGTSSESDEDWIIPRPKFVIGRMGLFPKRRSSEVLFAPVAPDTPSSGTDESDSSGNSTVFR